MENWPYDPVVASIGAAGGSPEVIRNLKHSPGGEKVVLCEMLGVEAI